MKVVAGDLIGVSGKVLEHTCIPTGIKRKLVKFDVNCRQTISSMFTSVFFRLKGLL